MMDMDPSVGSSSSSTAPRILANMRIGNRAEVTRDWDKEIEECKAEELSELDPYHWLMKMLCQVAQEKCIYPPHDLCQKIPSGQEQVVTSSDINPFVLEIVS